MEGIFFFPRKNFRVKSKNVLIILKVSKQECLITTKKLKLVVLDE